MSKPKKTAAQPATAPEVEGEAQVVALPEAEPELAVEAPEAPPEVEALPEPVALPEPELAAEPEAAVEPELAVEAPEAPPVLERGVTMLGEPSAMQGDLPAATVAPAEAVTITGRYVVTCPCVVSVGGQRATLKAGDDAPANIDKGDLADLVKAGAVRFA